MKKLRYGIIGFGNFAERSILPAIRASTNSEVVALQKRSLDVAREKAREHSVPYAFGTVEELVRHSHVDAVFIASANACHHPETVAAARAGKHVLVEKPMALTVREAEEMIRVCREHSAKLMVGHMVRLSPAVIRMRELIHSGVLGRIAFVKTEFIYDGRLSKRGWLLSPRVAGGGPIFDVGIHCLDTMRFLLKDEVVSVKGQLSPQPTKTQTETTASLSLQFSRGTIGSIYCSYESSVRRSFVEVVGTDASAYAYEFTRSSFHVDVHIVHGKNDSEDEHRVESFDIPDLYEREVSLFSESILGNSTSPISGEEGLANQRVLNAAMAMSLERKSG